MELLFFFLGGYYCDTVGSEEPNGQCNPGHYCTYGVDTATPDGISNRGMGNVCPPGHQCPLGTANAQPCDPGTYNLDSGQASCLQCLAGYYCLQNTSDPTANPCPSGYYCPPGNLFFPVNFNIILMIIR